MTSLVLDRVQTKEHSRSICLIIGDAFVDIVCKVGAKAIGDTDSQPRDQVGTILRPGADVLLKSPVVTLPGGSGINTATHLHWLSGRGREEQERELELQDAFGALPMSKFRVEVQSVLNADDAHGKILMDHCHNIGLDLKNRKPNCERSRASSYATGHCVVVVDERDRSFLTHRGCVDQFSPSDIDIESALYSTVVDAAKEEQEYDVYLHVHLAGYYNLPHFWNGQYEKRLQEVLQPSSDNQHNYITTSLVVQHDATEQWDGGLLTLLPMLSILFVNEVEAAGITKYRQQHEGTSWLGTSRENLLQHVGTVTQQASAKTLVIVTLGSEGAVAIQNGVVVAQQSGFTLPAQAIDATGAGDAFVAGFLAALMHEQHRTQADVDLFLPTLLSKWVSRALRLGCALGATCVMQEGASTPLPLEQINSFMSPSFT